jgi:hypothetical protein
VTIAVTWRRWSDGKVIEQRIDEHDLYRLQGDVLRVRRLPNARVVAARAFGTARKL